MGKKLNDPCEHAIPNMDPSWSCELVAAGDEGAHEMAMRWPLRWWAAINRKGIKIDPAIPVIGFGSASGSRGARVAIMAMSRSTEADTALRSVCTLQDEPAVNFSSYQLLIHPGSHIGQRRLNLPHPLISHLLHPTVSKNTLATFLARQA